MAGGIFSSQNKVLPGVYINTQSAENTNANIGTRGTVALAMPLSWGEAGKVQKIAAGEDLTPYIGYDITSDKALFIREMLKGSDTTKSANTILLYRLTGTSGAKAQATIGDLKATALYNGVRGNDISIAVSADPDNTGTYDVSTIVDGYVEDVQSVTALTGLVSNNWVKFTGEGSFTTTTGTALTGGVDPTVSNADYAAFLTAIEPYTFDILTYDGDTATVITAFIQFITRTNESIGRKCQLVIAGDNTTANTKYVIVAKNGVKLSDGTLINAKKATYWLAGVEAGALYNESLTYAQYPNAVEANPKLSDADAEAAVLGGCIAFIDDFDIVKICTDINSKTSVSVKEGAEYKKNRVMRVLMQFCNDTYKQFSLNYIGKVDNNDNGRALLRKWCIGYLNEMQANNGIQNFGAEDITVEAGNDVDSVVINVGIQPVDSIEKIYNTVTVNANGVTIE